MVSADNESDLFGRLCSGESSAYEFLIAQQGMRLRRYLTTMVGDEGTAEDLAQETFARVHREIRSLQDPGKLGSWVLSIAINLARGHLRHAARRGGMASLGESGAAGLSGARRSALSSIVSAESSELLALAIDRLPILLREAFVLHDVEGVSYPDIAEMTGTLVGTLQVRAHRARGLLRRQLGSLVDTLWLRPEPSSGDDQGLGP